MAYVLIVGRPNVGKSSLFNILAGRKMAIVAEEENTTRDVIEYELYDEETGVGFTLADSGGLNLTSKENILRDVNQRVSKHMDKADLIVVVVEYNVFSDVDEQIFRKMQKTGKPILVVANKADNTQRYQEAYELLRLGIPEENLFMVSAAHKSGISELEWALWEFAAQHKDDTDRSINDGEIKVALIGRPNVGKSSILNALVGEDRVMVKDEAGTTRDATDIRLDYEDKTIRIIDTAGLRKPGKIGIYNIESWSVLRTEAAISRADICAIVIDPIEGVTQNDKHIVGKALEEKKGVILVVNKWDLARAKSDLEASAHEERFLAYLQKQFPFLPWAMTVFCVATEDKNVREILEHVIGIDEQRKKRIPTGKFNAFLEEMVHQHAPRGRRKSHNPRVYYGSQVDANPPKFVIFTNNPEHIHFSWKRYLENKIREFFGFFGTAIEIEYRGKNKKDNPYLDKDAKNESSEED